MENGFDPILIEFVKENLLTIGAALALLKGIATVTPSTTDDKIITLFINVFKSLSPRQKQLTMVDEDSAM